MDGSQMSKEDQLRILDISLMCLFRYAKGGSFGQYVHMQKTAMLLAELRDQLAKGTKWEALPFTLDELGQMDRPPATLVAKKILEDLAND